MAPHTQEVWEQYENTGQVHFVGALTYLDDWNVINGGTWRKNFTPHLSFELSIASELQSHVNSNEFNILAYPTVVVIGVNYTVRNDDVWPIEGLEAAVESAIAEMPEVGVEDEIAVSFTTMDQNYPNPFNPSTTITFSLEKPQLVTLNVFNTAGQKVKTLVNGHIESGQHHVTWDAKQDDGSETASGVYFYKLQTPEYTNTKKMILLE